MPSLLPSLALPFSQVGNLAREGLRTLVVACKPLTAAQYEHFRSAMGAAKLAKTNRAGAVRAVWDMLQEEMKLLAVTAVEDRLQVMMPLLSSHLTQQL